MATLRESKVMLETTHFREGRQNGLFDRLQFIIKSVSRSKIVEFANWTFIFLDSDGTWDYLDFLHDIDMSTFSFIFPITTLLSGIKVKSVPDLLVAAHSFIGEIGFVTL